MSLSPSSSCISVRSTTRSPSASVTSGNWRRRLSSPRSTSITRMPSRRKIATSITCAPISGEPSGTTTSVKNFIRLRVPSRSAIESRFGMKRGTSSHMVAKPTMATAMPSGAISKRPKGRMPCARATPSTRRLVEVPIMRDHAAEHRLVGERDQQLGGREAHRVGELHRDRDHHRDERRVVGEGRGRRRRRCRRGPAPAPGSARRGARRCRAKLLISPVRTSPPETMNIAAIVQGAGLEKTLSTPSEGTMPTTTSDRRAEHRRHLDREDLERRRART